MAEMFVPEYLRDDRKKMKIISITRLPILIKIVRNLKKKKNKLSLILDLNMDDDAKKLKEIGNIAQSKLEDNNFGDTLDLHSQVLSSWYPS
jgi:hypothetical protein